MYNKMFKLLLLLKLLHKMLNDMEPTTTAAIISAAASAAGSGFSAVTGSNLNKKNRRFYEEQREKQNEFNAQQAQFAYERQRELLQYMNEYDSPFNQMQRYKAAGINPALAVSNISAAGTNASGVPAASGGEAPAYSVSNPMSQVSSDLSQIASIFANLKVQTAQAANLNADTEKKGSEKKNLDADTVLKDSQKAAVEASTKEVLQRIEDLNPKIAKKLGAEFDKLISDINNSSQLTLAQVSEIKQNILNLVESAKLTKKQSEFVEKQLEWYDIDMSNKAGIDIQTQQKLQNDVQFQDMINELRSEIFDGIRSNARDQDKTGLLPQLLLLYILNQM